MITESTCAYIALHTYAYIYIYIYLYIYTCTHAYIYIYIHIYTPIYVHACTRTCVHTTHIRTRVHTDMHTYTYIHTYTHAYIYIHTYIHTYIYIYIPVKSSRAICDPWLMSSGCVYVYVCMAEDDDHFTIFSASRHPFCMHRGIEDPWRSSRPFQAPDGLRSTDDLQTSKPCSSLRTSRDSMDSLMRGPAFRRFQVPEVPLEVRLRQL